MLKIDLGCGPIKRPDFIGVDFLWDPDVRCDISSERLPFDDMSADYIYSSHCIEHISHENLYHVLQEISRVAADNALIEIWHPHTTHGDAFVLGHINYLSEELYAGLHFYWRDYLGAAWAIQEVRYCVAPHVLEDIRAAGIDEDFAVSYMHGVVREIGIFMRVKRGTPTPQWPPETDYYGRFLCLEREHPILQLADGPRTKPLARRGLRSMNGTLGGLGPEKGAQNEDERLRAELARTISERDALATALARWSDAALAMGPGLRAEPPSRHRWWWRGLVRLTGVSRRLSPRARADRARDAGRWELAVRFYRDALDLDFGDAELWAQWGHALQQAGRPSEAEFAYQRSRELNAGGAVRAGFASLPGE
jgi:tetratricopeptide (TPR) repeat protein